jgi:hypothetical protein
MDPQTPAATLRRMINGFQVSQALHAAAVLGLADHLAGGPRTAEEIAADTGAHPRSLYRLMRALASLGALEEDSQRRFALTPMGSCLRTDAERSLAPWACLIGRPELWETWGHLLQSVRSGQNAFRSLHGMSIWEYRSQHPAAAEAFDRAMSGNARRIADSVVSAYDWQRFGTIIDVGGGQGTLLAAILARNPKTSGVVFDLPQVIPGAESMLRRVGLADRCTAVAGNFFEGVPEGAEAYVLKEVLHDWEDEEALAVLRSCRRAMRLGSVLLIVERLLEPPNQGSDGKLSDLNMLVMPGGLERTSEDYRALLDRAGLRLARTTATQSEFMLLEVLPL